jgi:hypothetical protein
MAAARSPYVRQKLGFFISKERVHDARVSASRQSPLVAAFCSAVRP